MARLKTPSSLPQILFRGFLEFVLPFVARRVYAEEGKIVEHYPKKRSEVRSLSLLPFSRWIIALGPLFLGAWVSFDGAELFDATNRFVRGEWTGDTHFRAVIFWLMAVIWTRALYIRLQQEDRSEDEYRASLHRALFNLPNLNVLWEYEQYHRIILDLVNAPSAQEDEPALTERIQSGLEVVAIMARQFARKEHTVYRANVMLVISKEDIRRVAPPIREGVRFVDQPIDPTRLDGLLVLVEELVSSTSATDQAVSGDERRNPYPRLILPLRREPPELILPGAPTAVLYQDMSVYEDTRKLADGYCRSFSAPVRNQIRSYFMEEGEGSHIRSFASIRIHSGSEPIGVLNIDSDEPCVLGTDEAYYPTFTTLLRPLVQLMAPLVDAYAQRWWSHNEDNAKESND